MKTQSLILLAGTISCIFLSCSKDKDETAPSITMLGKNPDTLIVKTVSSYDDPGATATDDKDGDITSKIVVATNVDVNKLGHYLVYYSVEDNSHNMSSKLTRVVEVVKADGNYSVDATCNVGSITDTIHIVSNAAYDTLTLNGFYNAAVAIKAALSNGKYIIFNQEITPGVDSVDGEITASGSNLNLSFNYHPNIGSPITCTAPMVKY